MLFPTPSLNRKTTVLEDPLAPQGCSKLKNQFESFQINKHKLNYQLSSLCKKPKMSYFVFDRNCNQENFQNAVIFCWQPGPAKFAVQTYIVPDDSILKIVHGFFHICQSDLISHDSVH